MKALSAKASRLLEDLRANAEGCEVREKDGSIWRSVYLDNVRPDDMTPHQFRWHLSSLAKNGLYRSLDGEAFGEVLTLEPRA